MPKQDLFQLEIKACQAWTLHDPPEVYEVTEIQATRDSSAVSEMTALLLTIAKALVDDTDAVRVETIVATDSSVLRLHVSPNDIGKLIGKQGRTARSLRTILGAASMKLQCRFALDIVEAGRGTSAPGQHEALDD